MTVPERRWSGAFRTCSACGKRNFAGRSKCSACGAALLRPEAPPSPSPAFLIGHRGSDRFQGRGVALAGGTVVLVALAGGFFVYRFLRGPDLAPLLGTGTETITPRPPSPVWEMEAPAPPAFSRPEDRANHEKGRRLLAAGDAKGALRPLGELARRFPRDAVVVHDYGIALVLAGDRDLGIFHLEHASRLAPGIGSFRLDLVRALLAADRRGHAARELRELLARDPTHQVAADLLASLGDAAAAAGGVVSPGTAGGMDLGGAAADAGSPRPAGGGTAFTNEDLDRRRTAPPSMAPSPAMVSPSAASPAPLPSPSPSG